MLVLEQLRLSRVSLQNSYRRARTESGIPEPSIRAVEFFLFLEEFTEIQVSIFTLEKRLNPGDFIGAFKRLLDSIAREIRSYPPLPQITQNPHASEAFVVSPAGRKAFRELSVVQITIVAELGDRGLDICLIFGSAGQLLPDLAGRHRPATQKLEGISPETICIDLLGRSSSNHPKRFYQARNFLAAI